MNAHLRANLWLLGLTVLLCCVLYLLILWAVGQTVFPDKASGSLIVEDGRIIGSRLIAQPFTQPEYFWPRPSAVSYDASNSGGSNLGASNPKLRERVVQSLDQLRRYPHHPNKDVPADMVMTSGSGLDPHITLDNALYQLDRVAQAWATKSGLDGSKVRMTVEKMLRQNATSPLGGLAGVELVNVLEINLLLREEMRRLAKTTAGKDAPLKHRSNDTN